MKKVEWMNLSEESFGSNLLFWRETESYSDFAKPVCLRTRQSNTNTLTTFEDLEGWSLHVLPAFAGFSPELHISPMRSMVSVLDREG